MEEPLAGILERTRILRTKEERIATLETENAILHIKIAQLQSSFKKLLSTSYEKQLINSGNHHRCKKCECYRERVSELHNQIKLLQKGLSRLQAQYSAYEHQLSADLKTLSHVIPRVVQRSKQTSAETNALHTKYLRERSRRKELHNALVELRGNIRVHCRVRPVLDFDKTNETECSITCVDDEILKVKDVRHSSISGLKISQKMFEFERVHGPCESQLDVFSQVKPLITSLLDGYNVCIMAYGQTGSGKSYTMLGDCSSSVVESQSGVVPLAGAELFRLLKEKELDSAYNVSVTVAEVYNEQIRDLLAPKQDSTKHDVVTGLSGNMEVTNLMFKPVKTYSDLLAAIYPGIAGRASEQTLIHDHSSRSHLIVTIHVRSVLWSDSVSIASSSSSISLNTTITPVGSRESTPMVSPVGSPRPKQNLFHSSSQITVSSSAPSLCVPPLYSTKLATSSALRATGSQASLISPRDFHVKLQLVDLAGSVSGVEGENLKEAQYINRSLSSLSDILNALAEKRSHIPYRNSVLTHLLQDTIGGDAKMVLMLCVSPTSYHLAESVRVLRFGARARQVQRTHNSCKRRKRNRDYK